MKAKALNQNFVLLIIGQALSMFGTVLLKFTVSLLILDLTSSAALFGTITAISYLPPVFLSLIAGIIADRNNKRNLMIALDGLYGIMAVLLVLSLSFSNILILITVIMVGLAIVSSFETPVVQSSIPLIQEKTYLIQSNAIVSQINMLANLIGPLLAGLLYSVVGKTTLQGVRIIFWGCAICFFSAAILEAFVKIPKITLTPISNPLHAIKKDLGESLYFLTSKQIYVFKAILLNTVFVFLIQRCIKKGAIERSEPGFICHALVPQAEVQEAETNELIDRVYDGSADKLFAALLGRKKLSAEQIEKLKQIVGDLE